MFTMLSRRKRQPKGDIGGRLKMLFDEAERIYNDPELCTVAQHHVFYAMHEISAAIDNTPVETDDPRYGGTSCLPIDLTERT